MVGRVRLFQKLSNALTLFSFSWIAGTLLGSVLVRLALPSPVTLLPSACSMQLLRANFRDGLSSLWIKPFVQGSSAGFRRYGCHETIAKRTG